ncbi:MAG: ribbon-helix-helix protein, CopG family [Rhizobiaceae bacterium]|nr:ribbon-helix-helix protein, CopG family [Rhizobiaceae bacterium]
MREPVSDHKVTIAIGPDLLAYLDAEAADLRLSRSCIVRQALVSRRATQSRFAAIEAEIAAQEEGTY